MGVRRYRELEAERLKLEIVAETVGNGGTVPLGPVPVLSCLVSTVVTCPKSSPRPHRLEQRRHVFPACTRHKRSEHVSSTHTG